MTRLYRNLLICLLAGLAALPAWGFLRKVAMGGIQQVKGKWSVAERVDEFGPAVRARLAPEFKRVGVSYPPRKAVLVGLKEERRLEVWVADDEGRHKLLKTYPILAASGGIGPKLREGDRQVPEGLYAIESLNPNSLYHLALRVNYPNQQDRAQARADGRTRLGGDIMIHGRNASIGCLAMGDPAAEDLFVLAAETGIGNLSVILSPVDFRVRELPAGHPPLPAWTADLYARIRKAMSGLKTATPQSAPEAPTVGPGKWR